MVTTIQMSGVLVGCFVAGILGDMIGRKPTFFLSLCLVIVFNVIAYFSVSWEMYAAVRFGIGLGNTFITHFAITKPVTWETVAQSYSFGLSRQRSLVQGP